VVTNFNDFADQSLGGNHRAVHAHTFGTAHVDHERAFSRADAELQYFCRNEGRAGATVQAQQLTQSTVLFRKRGLRRHHGNQRVSLRPHLGYIDTAGATTGKNGLRA
jgi:hypothetical protein